MKRLLVISDEYPPVRGGVANYLHGVLEAFCTYADVRLLAPPDLAEKAVAPFPVVPAPFRSRWLVPRWIGLVPALLRLQADVSGDAYAASHLLPYGTAAWLASRLSKKKTVVFVHGLDIARAELQPRKRSLAARVLGDADIVVANSEYTLSRAKALAPLKDGVVVYPCPAVDPKGDEPPPARRFVLAAGRMVPRKGFRTLLRAVAQLRAEAPDFRLVMVGDGPERAEVLDDRAHLGLEDAVEVRSATDDELRTLFAQCAFFALPTQSSDADPEGFGIVFIEAAGFGKAVVAGVGGGVGEAVLDKETGLLVDGKDPNAIAQALLALWRDPAYAALLGETGRRRVAERFRYIHAIQPLVDAWNRLWSASA